VHFLPGAPKRAHDGQKNAHVVTKNEDPPGGPAVRHLDLSSLGLKAPPQAHWVIKSAQ
jgi:hypothetical protein